MKALLSMMVILGSTSAFAQGRTVVCESTVDYDRLCAPTINNRRVDLTSDADMVCERLGYPKGAVAKSVIGTRDSDRFERKDRHSYLGNIQVNGKGWFSRKAAVTKIYETDSREAIFSIACAK